MPESRQQIAEFELLELEGKQAEERLKHINAVLWEIHAVNQLVVREKDQDKLLRGVCERLIETRGCNTVWIAVFDKSGGLVPTAEACLGKDFLPIMSS